jgi:hypothetical protein
MCPMRGRWDPVNDDIRQAMAGITLADMRNATVPRTFRAPGIPALLLDATPAIPAVE